MTSIIIPRRHYGQPQGNLELDKAHPLAQGLIGCWTPGITLLNHVTGQFAPASGPLISVGSAEGVALDFESNRYVTAMQNADIPVAPLTFFAQFYSRNPTASGGKSPIGCHKTGTGFCIEFNSSGEVQAIVGTTNGWARNSTQVKPAPYQVLTMAMTMTTGRNEHYVFVDGRQLAMGYVHGTPLKSDIPLLIGYNSHYGNPHNGGVLIAGVHNRYMTPAECISLTANPWQIFKQSPTLLTDEG